MNDAAIEDEEKEKDGTRRMDPELRTIGQMIRMIEELDEAARGRVVKYLSSRYPV